MPCSATIRDVLGSQKLRTLVLLGMMGLACLLRTAIPAPAAQADSRPAEWPGFLGPQRNGISRETGLLEKWPENGPREVWRVPGGVGMSGLAISQGRLLTLVQRDRQQWLLCLQAKTGEQLWRVAVAPEFQNGMGNGPRGTPTIAGDRVFVFTGEGILAAHRLEDGKPLWSRAVVADLQGKIADYGMACSPLVVGEQVIVQAGAPRAAVVACDIQTGKQLWTAGDDPAGYSSPALLDVGGRQQIVVFTGASVLGLAPGTGTVLWRHPYITDFACNIATPIAYKGMVFVSSGENHGSVLLSLKPEGDKFSVSEVWSSQGPKSVLRNEWQTSLLIDGHLYGMDNVGGAGPITHFTCVKADTGERVWQQLRFGKGNLIAADGKIFLSTMKGELILAKVTPAGYEELGRSQVLGPTRQAPALSAGLLYLRDDKEIVCVDVSQR